MAGHRLRAGVPLAFLFLVLLLAGCRKKEQPPETINPADLRQPAVAGSFYPSDSAQLRNMVAGSLAQARKAAPTAELRALGEVVGILVPHAGYGFSGLTAAHAFAALEGHDYDTVLLIGSPHAMAVRGAAVYCGAGFQTPLGPVAVDRTLARAIASCSLLRDDPTPHVAEHSLEVQLPFLVSVLKSVKIVPILVMGDQSTLNTVAQSIIDAVQKTPAGFPRTLIVISSDLAHYPSAADAGAVDRQILSAFCSLEPDALLAADRAIMARNVANLACSMCGLDAAYVGLQLARAAGATEARLLDARTSADAGVSGAGPDSVVGYGAVLLAREPSTSDRSQPRAALMESLTVQEQNFLLRIARQSIEEYLRKGKEPTFTAPASCPHLLEKRGCFVTLYTLPAAGLSAGSSSGSSGAGQRELRGCVGVHTAEVPLVLLVPEMALESAFGDPRFPQLRPAELGRLQIEISVYRTSVTRIRSAKDFVVGRQGIIIKVGAAQATFLPQVAVEQRWDRMATLENLCLKAGLPRDAWKRKDAQFFVYETQVFEE